MDNLTHTLTAVALSQAGLNRKTRFATLALVLGANAPDVDIVTSLGGSATYLKYHRGITHSIPGVIVLAAVVAALVYLAGRKAGPPRRPSAPPLDPRWLFLVTLISTALHLLMDFTNSYGVRPFLPFSGRWYAWDIMFIIDPVLLALLIAGLGLPAIFRLVSEEVGARKRPPRGGAIFALCAMLALWGVRDLAHRRVLGMLDSHTYADQNPVRLGAFPSPANPFAWTGVAETGSAYHILPVDARADDIDSAHATVFHKPEPSPALDAALQTRTGVIFRDFARFLWPEVIEDSDGFEVRLRDLRFYSPDARLRGLSATIRLDQKLRPISESFSFTGGSRGEKD
ncbi:MAG TPA: metal-dependent hydrolase [Terriglobia bacterium]|nr:metal-dependent hydrolase [Terriglobia bacterium]